MITVYFTEYYDPIVDLYCRQRVYARVVFLNQHCVDTYPGTCMHQIISSRRNTHTHARTYTQLYWLYHTTDSMWQVHFVIMVQIGCGQVRIFHVITVCAWFCYWYKAATQKSHAMLTHWDRMTHICINKLTIIGSDNGLSPYRRQAIM